MRRGIVALLGLAVVLGTNLGGAAQAEPREAPRVVFDDLHPASGVRVKAVVSYGSQRKASEFNLRVQLWDENEGREFAGAPTLHVIVPDASVSLQKLWRLKTYDGAGQGSLTRMGEGTGDPLPTPPEALTRDLASSFQSGRAEFVWADERARDASEGAETETERRLLRAVRLENDFDTYTIPGSLYDARAASGYEFVIPLRVEGGQFAARIVAHEFGWRAGPDGDVPVAFDLQFPVEEPEPAAPRKPSPVEIVHSGVIVRIAAEDPQRKPYLRVDVVLRFAGGATGDHDAKMQRLAKTEGKALAMKGLMRDMATAEQIEADQLFHMERAGRAIREVIIEAGFPPPFRVLFSSWVIQG